jgi:tRNA threonylcarbamoyladenosine biosynthesis protein TsaB
MLILAIDTSGRHGSVALCRGDASAFETLQLVALEGGTYSASLIPTIDSILQKNNVEAAELDGFAVVSGPGSFTGLRVGLATIKGLCEVSRKPLMTVSMPEAVAVTHGARDKCVTAALDAGRGEVYVGEYQVSLRVATLTREYIVKLSEFEAAGGSDLLTPDSSVGDSLKARGIDVRLVAPVQADGIARIGIRKLLAGDVADHATVDVNYIRRSDAEMFSTQRRA